MSLPSPAEQSNSQTGSPLPGEPVYLAIGKLRRPHGVRGEMILEVWTDFPERIRASSMLYLGQARQPLQLRSRRAHAEGLLVAFSGLDTPEAVGKLRNFIAYVRADDIPPLPAGEYYHHQLIGMQVVDEAGAEVGYVAEILETGANDVLAVRAAGGGELLLPVIDSVVLAVDLEAKRIRVHLLPGLEP